MKDDSRTVKDPICGKSVDTFRARAVGIFGGVTYYFCSAECKAKFVDPRKSPRAHSASDDQVIELEAEPGPPSKRFSATDRVDALDELPSNTRRYVISALVILVIVAGVVWVTMINR